MRIRKPFLRIGRNLWFWARVLPMVHRNLLVTAQVNARSKLSDKAIRTTGFAFSFIRISIAQIRERGPSSLPESEFRGDLSSYLGRAFFRQIAGGGGSASFRKWDSVPNFGVEIGRGYSEKLWPCGAKLDRRAGPTAAR